MYLFIDTTDPNRSVVGLLNKEGDFLSMLEWPGKQNQSEELLVKIDQILSEANVYKKVVDKVVVVTGPGSYTGQRVGISTANALALSLRIPVLGMTKDEWERHSRNKMLQKNDEGFARAKYFRPPHITTDKRHRQ